MTPKSGDTNARRRPTLTIVHLTPMPIFEQLRREEALLRAGKGNWCLINDGTPPAIVMGLSGTMDDTVEAGCQLPIIRRFSGGGTVVVDETTIFWTLIIDEDDLPCNKNPVDVMAWTGHVLAPLFMPHALRVEEQDYVIGGKKIGGNAQSFSCGRVLHHTSWLWSWRHERMALLKMPQRQPAYREQREHSAFCQRLSTCFQTKESFVRALEKALEEDFDCRKGAQGQIDEALHRPHRKELQWLCQGDRS